MSKMLLTVQFLHPEFLYGLSLLTVPVILHLFSLKRYKKVYFSNFSFLEALQQQKKNSSRLKKWLLLLLRLLIITCIVLAFATPYIRPANKPAYLSGSQVLIYADNSFSMSNAGVQGNLLDEAKKYLLDIVNTYPTGTGFRLLTNQVPDDVLLTKEQMYAALGRIKVSARSKTLSQICKEAIELSKHQAHTLFIISDFQKINCDFQQLVSDSLQNIVLLLLKPENRDNVYIRDVQSEQAFHKKNQNNKIRIFVANSSNQSFHNIPVTLSINQKKKSVSTIDVPAHSETTVEINYLNTEERFYKGVVEISDFPLVFDNQFYFCYETDKNTDILYLWQNRENPYFGKLFSDTTTFNFTSQPIAQTVKLNPAQYHLIIADGISNVSSGYESLLEEYLTNGGNLFILPASSSIDAQNRFLQKIRAPQFSEPDSATQIAYIETQSPLFRNVFEKKTKDARLPYAHFFYQLLMPEKTEKLLTDKSGHTLLAAKTFGKGNVYTSAFSYAPENSDMVYHPLFVPLLVNMANNINTGLQTSYFLNLSLQATISKKNYKEGIPLQIRKDDRQFEFIPDIRKDFNGDLIITNAGIIEEAGHYVAVQNDQIMDVLAWNYNRKESQMEFSDEKELSQYFPDAKIENIRSSTSDRNNGLIKEIVLQDHNKYLTFWFLLSAALALVAEQIVWRKKLE